MERGTVGIGKKQNISSKLEKREREREGERERERERKEKEREKERESERERDVSSAKHNAILPIISVLVTGQGSS